jgi:hypothetical protein
MTAVDCGHERQITELREQLAKTTADLAAAELERDELQDDAEFDAAADERIDDLLSRAADMAHALHDERAPRRLCREEMCRLFDEAGVPDR